MKVSDFITIIGRVMEPHQYIYNLDFNNGDLSVEPPSFYHKEETLSLLLKVKDVINIFDTFRQKIGDLTIRNIITLGPSNALDIKTNFLVVCEDYRGTQQSYIVSSGSITPQKLILTPVGLSPQRMVDALKAVAISNPKVSVFWGLVFEESLYYKYPSLFSLVDIDYLIELARVAADKFPDSTIQELNEIYMRIYWKEIRNGIQVRLETDLEGLDGDISVYSPWIRVSTL